MTIYTIIEHTSEDHPSMKTPLHSIRGVKSFPTYGEAMEFFKTLPPWQNELWYEIIESEYVINESE